MLNCLKQITDHIRNTKPKKEATMLNFTDKEKNLLLETVLERELGVILADNIADLRSKTDIFANDSEITIEKVQNKQDKTCVSVFITKYINSDGDNFRAYMPTL